MRIGWEPTPCGRDAERRATSVSRSISSLHAANVCRPRRSSRGEPEQRSLAPSPLPVGPHRADEVDLPVGGDTKSCGAPAFGDRVDPLGRRRRNVLVELMHSQLTTFRRQHLERSALFGGERDRQSATVVSAGVITKPWRRRALCTRSRPRSPRGGSRHAGGEGRLGGGGWVGTRPSYLSRLAPRQAMLYGCAAP